MDERFYIRLISVEVKNFRNIIDTGIVQIEPDITCLVGKNESGKTAFLNALYRLFPKRANVAFSVPDQYPAWLEKKDRMKGLDLDEVIPITAQFEISDEYVKILEEEFGDGILTRTSFTVTRRYNSNVYYTLALNEKPYVQYQLSKVDMNQTLKTEAREIDTIQDLYEFVDRMQTRGNVSDANKSELQDIKGSVESEVGEDGLSKIVYNHISQYIPKFFYFHQYSTLPYTVDIKKILESPEEDLEDGEITARALLRIAGADDEYLTNPDYERRKRELENVANAITEDVLKFWSQNQELRVLPDIIQQTVSTPQGPQAVIDELKIRIWDNRHLLSLPFNEHSSGFQWFFSFLAAFSEYKYSEEPVIILLDEPALGLHARAQKDFLKFIEEKLAPVCQVIYTTHSPFMVQPNNLDKVRIVEDNGRTDGAKITSEILTTDKDTLFPLQGALGYDMAQHLFIAPHNLVVEGTSDYTYLSLISEFLGDKNREKLKTEWSIVPVGGADLIPTFVALLGHHLDVTVLVDSQKADHQKLTTLAEKGYLAHQRIITIGDLIDRRHADIEDLFTVADYLKLYNGAFSETITPPDLKGNDKIISKICRHKQIEDFNHGKPADYFLRNRDVILDDLEEGTLDNFEKLIVKINSTL